MTTAGYAAVQIPRDSVGSRELKNDGIKAADLAAGSVGTEAVEDSSLQAGDFAGGLPAGPKGDTGAQGIPGAAGAQGLQGIQGIAGTDGNDGDDGLNGTTGAPGLIKLTTFTYSTVTSLLGTTTWTQLTPAVGTVNKQQGSSRLMVTWNGNITAAGGGSSCVWAIRIDGNDSSGAAPTGLTSAAPPGTAMVKSNATEPVSTSAVFEGLTTGNHDVQLWRMNPTNGPQCHLNGGDAAVANLPQQFTVLELPATP